MASKEVVQRIPAILREAGYTVAQIPRHDAANPSYTCTNNRGLSVQIDCFRDERFGYVLVFAAKWPGIFRVPASNRLLQAVLATLRESGAQELPHKRPS